MYIISIEFYIKGVFFYGIIVPYGYVVPFRFLYHYYVISILNKD